jgi:outer membrane protein assembly factor BamB
MQPSGKNQMSINVLSRREVAALAVFLALPFVSSPIASTSTSQGDPSPQWPEFRGRHRDNVSSETGLLKQWPEGGPPLLWKFSDCGRGYATVSVAEGLLFTAGDFGREELVIAIDRKGKLAWKTPNGASWRGASPGSRATPTYRDGNVYHMNPTGRLAAFRARSGQEIWAVDLKETFGVEGSSWALSESVVVEQDFVLCVPGGSRGRIVALDKQTGATVWANTEISQGTAHSSPRVVTHHGVRQLIAFLAGSVVSVDVRTGELLWSQPHRARYNLTAVTPFYHEGYVFVSSGYGIGGRLLKISEDSQSVEQIWRQADIDTCHGGIIFLDGYLYGSGCRQSRKGFLCVDFSTGKTMWSHRELGKTTPLYADGLLYCLSNQSRMSLIEPDPNRCRILSQFDLPKGGEGTSIAQPVICDGRLYIRHGTFLYAYDIKDRKSHFPASG